MIGLSSDTVLVFAESANWWINWHQISSPVTAPESEFEVFMIFLTMIFGLPIVAKKNASQNETRSEFKLCSKLSLNEAIVLQHLESPLGDPESFWDLFSTWGFARCVSLLTWLSFFLLMFVMRSDKTPLNMTSCSMMSFNEAVADKEWDEFLIISDCQNLFIAMISSDNSMNDSLTPSKVFGWRKRGLNLW